MNRCRAQCHWVLTPTGRGAGLIRILNAHDSTEVSRPFCNSKSPTEGDLDSSSEDPGGGRTNHGRRNNLIDHYSVNEQR